MNHKFHDLIFVILNSILQNFDSIPLIIILFKKAYIENKKHIYKAFFFLSNTVLI